jgi:hypothetical protein
MSFPSEEIAILSSIPERKTTGVLPGKDFPKYKLSALSCERQLIAYKKMIIEGIIVFIFFFYFELKIVARVEKRIQTEVLIYKTEPFLRNILDNKKPG